MSGEFGSRISFLQLLSLELYLPTERAHSGMDAQLQTKCSGAGPVQQGMPCGPALIMADGLVEFKEAESVSSFGRHGVISSNIAFDQ